MLDIVGWVGVVWDVVGFGENGKVVLKLLVICVHVYIWFIQRWGGMCKTPCGLSAEGKQVCKLRWSKAPCFQPALIYPTSWIFVKAQP